MKFSLFMYILFLLIPLLMIIFGRWMIKCPPKNINSFVGYRTSMSTKNMDTWNFAHKVCGKLWWKIGWIMLVLTIIVESVLMKFDKKLFNMGGVIILTIQCIILVISIFPVEKSLNRTFNKDGSRKKIGTKY